MDRLSAMALLVKVAELGSMSAAARVLNMPLTTVSRQIGELENTLGVRLMIRTTRKLTLTDAGVDYVAAARRILEEVENAERRAAGEYQEPKGELVLSAPTMFGRQHVLPVVTDFLARYPQIRVRLLLSDRNADLVGDHIDLAVRIGTLPDSGMVATRLGEMRIVTCAHPALLEKHGIPERPRELAALPIIRIESPMPYRGWRFNAEEAEDRLVALRAGAYAAAGAVADHAGERRRRRPSGGRRGAPAALPGDRRPGPRRAEAAPAGDGTRACTGAPAVHLAGSGSA